LIRLVRNGSVAWFAAIVCRERCGVERRIAEAEFQIGAEPTRTPESCIRECCRYSGACAPWRSGTSSQVQHVIQDIVYCICCTRNPCLVSDHKSGSETWAKVAADKLDQRSRGCRLRDYAISLLAGRALESRHAGIILAKQAHIALVNDEFLVTNNRLFTCAT
jgi:hypothetical protein